MQMTTMIITLVLLRLVEFNIIIEVNCALRMHKSKLWQILNRISSFKSTRMGLQIRMMLKLNQDESA